MISNKKRLPLLLLFIFLGPLGFHRFYAGKWGTGFIFMFTGGLLGLGLIYDLILILTGGFEDKSGFRIVEWV